MTRPSSTLRHRYSALRSLLLWTCLLFALSYKTFECRASEEISATHSSQISFETISIEDGLSQSTIFCIEQDHLGYLWLCTEDGLNRWDGYEFRVYKHSTTSPGTLSNNWISDVLVDRNHQIWVATQTSLERFLPNSNNFVTLPIPFAGDSIDVEDLFETSDGALWLGTSRGLFAIVDGQAVERVEIGTTGHEYHVKKILEDSQRALLLSTWGHGVIRFDPSDRSSELFLPEGNSDLRFVRAVYEEGEGTYLIGTKGGLRRLDRSTGIFSRPAVPETLIHARITTMYKDREGTLWFGTRGSGAFSVRAAAPATFQHYVPSSSDPLSISNVTLWEIVEDDAQNLWLGAGTGGGLNRAYRRRFHHVASAEVREAVGTSRPMVWSIATSQDGRLLVGTSDGLDIYTPSQKDAASFHLSHHLANASTDPDSLSGNRVWSIAEGFPGELWLGTHHSGVNRLDLDSLYVTRFQKDCVSASCLSDNRIRSLLVDRQKNIWIGTNGGGLNKLERNSGQFTHFVAEVGNDHSLSDDRVWSLLEGASGEIWVGTDGGGLNSLREHESVVERLSPQDVPGCGRRVWALLQQGTDLWVGSQDGGICVLDTVTRQVKHSFSIDTSDIPSNTVYALLQAENGDVWCSTPNGLGRFDAAGNFVSRYSIHDGLLDSEFNFGAAHKADSGRLYFGGLNGVTFFDPKNLTPLTSTPPVRITGFSLYDQLLNPNPRPQDYVHLRYNENFFSFSFAALDFVGAEDIHYRYILEGVDEHWTETTASTRQARYTFVPSGQYVFRVKSTNRDGAWSDQEAQFHVEIIEPFWRSTSIWVLAAVLVLLALGFRLWLRERGKTRLRQLLADGREAEKHSIADVIHAGPMQDLIGMRFRLEHLIGGPTEKEHLIRNELCSLRDETSSLESRLRKICWEQARPPALSQYGLATAIANHIGELEESGIVVSLDLADDIDLLDDRRALALYRAYQVALDNALQHAQASAISVRSYRQDRDFRLVVSDNGVGFAVPKDWLDQQPLHYGILNSMDSLAAVGGSFQIRSTPGTGTTIEAAVPLQTHPTDLLINWMLEEASLIRSQLTALFSRIKKPR